MPLKLVTGPANAAKAGEVLGGLRDRLAEEPVLVVPTSKDVEHAQRELAERGRDLRGPGRGASLAVRADRRSGPGSSGRAASEVQCELIAEEAVRRSGLEVLAASAAQPGFARAALRFATELERSMVEPARFTQAMRRWAGDGPRRPYAEEVATVYRRYREGLDAAGLVDEDLFAWRALNELRENPLRWRGTPVFVYGFDDFDPLQLDALETLRAAAAPTWWSRCPFEPGREAFKAVAESHGRLVELADEEVELEPLDDHYDPGSRPALHHLERGLFAAEQPERVEPGEAVRLHSAGGERAEVELVRRRGARAAARGHAAGRRGGDLPRPRPLRVAGRAGLRGLRHPVLDRPHGAAAPDRAWAAACWPCCAARCWRARPRTC